MEEYVYQLYLQKMIFNNNRLKIYPNKFFQEFKPYICRILFIEIYVYKILQLKEKLKKLKLLILDFRNKLSEAEKLKLEQVNTWHLKFITKTLIILKLIYGLQESFFINYFIKKILLEEMKNLVNNNLSKIETILFILSMKRFLYKPLS